MNHSKRLQTAHRTALTELVSDIVNLPVFDSHEKQVLAFACLYSRIFKGETDIAYITALAAGGLNKQNNNYALYQKALKMNAHMHNFSDEDGDLVFNQATGGLSVKWTADIVNIAHALEAVTPESFLPTSKIQQLSFPSHGNGVPLINTARKFGYQMPKDMPKAYAALNALQAQEFRLSPDILALKNLPISLDISKNYSARHIMLANMDAFKDTFHFRYTMDYRGRVYCRSILANTQGDSFAKASITFAESKPLGKYGMSALRIHFANCSGHDKLSFTDRLLWATGKGMIKAYKMVATEGNWDNIAPLIEDHKHAYEEYTAACELVRADQWAMKGNDITIFESPLITHQDATNSGFQFGAALTSDRETAEEVNITARLTKHDKPADLYNKMAINLNKLLKPSELLPKLTKLKIAIDRSFCKTPIMVTGYGAGIKAVIRDVTKYLLKQKNITLEEDLQEELKPYMKDALQQTASAMVDITKVMHTHAKEVVNSGLETIEWTCPDGFRVIQQKRDNSGRKIELSNGQTTFQKQSKGHKDPIDEAGMTKALPPNFIHSMDAQMLRTASIECQLKDIHFAPIHDSFGTHAGSFFELNTVLKQAFVDTMDYDWYQEFCQANQLTGVNIKTGDYEAKECLKAVYMFS